MKQHITVEQLKKINSDRKVCKLNNLMEHEWDLTKEEFRKYSWYKVLEDTANYCTIGKMIEILQNLDFNISIEVLYCTTITINKCGLEEPLVVKENELCDALWEVVKLII